MGNWTWTDQLSSEVISNVVISDDGTKLVGCNQGAAGSTFFSLSGGTNWTGTAFNSVDFIAANSNCSKVIGGVQTGYLYYSDDYGVTYTQQNEGGLLFKDWRAFASNSDGSIFYACPYNDGSIWTTDNFGTNWNETTSTNVGFPFYTDIATTSNGISAVVAIYGYKNGILVTTNSGVDWTHHASASGSGYWQSIDSSSNGEILYAASTEAAGTSGYIWKSTDFGTSWSSITAAGFWSWQGGITTNADGTKIAACAYGDDGAILISLDSGATWDRQDASNSQKLTIDSSDDFTKLVVGDADNIQNIRQGIYSEDPPSGLIDKTTYRFK